METVYIQFQMPKSSTKTEGESFFRHSVKKFATNILAKVLPVANPDFDEKIEDVEYWLVECDRESGIPQREIGIDEQGKVIMKMPFRENYGYWTDNNMLLNDFKEHFQVSSITKEAFEEQWEVFDKMSDFQIRLEAFKVLSTGADGGHKYVSSDIKYNGRKRNLTVFFADKADEEKITSLQAIRITGTLKDEGVHYSLIVLHAKLVDE